MQFVSGESLQARIDRIGPLQLCEILRIGMQVAGGLAAAHQQGLVHRDIKPSNILLEEDVDRALISDFGLARAADDASLTRTGFHPGTPQYMSPEQVSGQGVDPQRLIQSGKHSLHDVHRTSAIPSRIFLWCNEENKRRT